MPTRDGKARSAAAPVPPKTISQWPHSGRTPHISEHRTERPQPRPDTASAFQSPNPLRTSTQIAQYAQHPAGNVHGLRDNSVSAYGNASKSGALWRGVRSPSLAWTIDLNVFWSIKRERWRSNCKEIEIPLDFSKFPETELEIREDTHSESNVETDQDQIANMYIDKMGLDADTILSLAFPSKTTSTESHTTAIMPAARDLPPSSETFPFMLLPLELRLKVYEYLLPSRTHTIVSQYPHNGSFFSAAANVNAFTQSLYPPQHKPTTTSPHGQRENLTTYKLLNANFHRDFPHPSIHPAILRTCRQIHQEAEPVLYGADTVFDFGAFVDAVVPFFTDRGAGKAFVRNVRVAREIPTQIGAQDALWERTCDFFRRELCSLRVVDLTVWSASGRDLFPEGVETLLEGEDEKVRAEEAEERRVRGWREWDYVEALAKAKGLREVKITYWGFPVEEKEGFGATEMRGAFDGWLAKRMVADELVKERMIKDECVFEGVVVLPLSWSRDI